MTEIDLRILSLIKILIFLDIEKDQTTFGKKIGMSSNSISNIRAGSHHFTLEQAHKIIEVYKVLPDYIHGKAEKPWKKMPGALEFTKV